MQKIDQAPHTVNSLLAHGEHANPLLALTPALLHHIRGDRRNQLLTYLKHWDEHATILRYLDVWLAADPNLATLRQARAEALIALGQQHAALGEIDALDEERGVTAGRRQLRVAALIALGAWDTLEQFDPPLGTSDRGEMLLAQGRPEDAKHVFAQAAALREGPPSLGEIRAAVACGELERARALLQERRSARGDAPMPLHELRVQQAVMEASGDREALAEIMVELGLLEGAERERLLELLGLTEQVDLEVVPDVPAYEEGVVEVPEAALSLLQTQWGYGGFRGGQAATIARVLQDQPVLAVLPTGAGKSLTYQLPALLLAGATVVISPLIALMKDQIDGLPVEVRTQAVAINSSLSASEVSQRLREVRAGRYKLVYVAPERMRQQGFVQALREVGIARFVVDEAHCVSLWGLSFRPDYLFLSRVIDELGRPPVLALTATATPDTRTEITAQLGAMELVAASVFRSNLHFSVVPVQNADAKMTALVEQCRAIDGSILVYARARDRCEELARQLQRAGISAGYYHAQVDDRAGVQDAFMNGRVRVLVATVAFGMGVDKPDIRAIIHYNLPQSVEAYYQEAGRAGRDGAPAHCVLLYTSADRGQLTHWLREGTLTRTDLRAVYRVLRDRAEQGWALISSEALQYAVPHLDDTQLRVALGMLERVGLLVRHFDLPRRLRLARLDIGADSATDPLFQELVEAITLLPQMVEDVELVPLAERLGLRPDQLEGHLLQWASNGLLRLDVGARELALELLEAPADTPTRIEELLQEYATRQDARIEAMVGYAKGLSCRHRALAAHFGERLANCGTCCDVCCGEQTSIRTSSSTPSRRLGPMLPPGSEADAVALRALRDLPYAVGRTGLAHFLVGSAKSAVAPERCAEFGKLAGWTQKATIALIDELAERGLIVREDGIRPLIRLTKSGYHALDDGEKPAEY